MTPKSAVWRTMCAVSELIESAQRALSSAPLHRTVEGLLLHRPIGHCGHEGCTWTGIVVLKMYHAMSRLIRAQLSLKAREMRSSAPDALLLLIVRWKGIRVFWA